MALAVQFVLSFGHVHAAALAAPGDHPVAAAAAVGAPDQSPGDHHDKSCAICAVMAQASSLITGGPVILLAPQAYQLLSRTTAAEFFHLAAPHGEQQPRAPPAS